MVLDVEGAAVPIYSQGSIGLHIYGENGGGFLSAHRFSIDAFETCIRNSFNGNGDKSMFQESLLVGGIIYDNRNNTQAIGWSFINCAGQATITCFRMGGVGQTVIFNGVFDLKGSFMQFTEGSGNPGPSEQDPYWCGSTLTIGTKLEQHGDANYPGANLLVDARDSKKTTGADGTNVSSTFIDVHITGSPGTIPLPDDTDIIVVGDEMDGNKGPSALRLQFLFGWVRGIVKWNSTFLGRTFVRIPFLHMTKAPKPEKAKLLGPGNHPLMEWRGCENVPVDQYRGGQSHIGAIDGRKAFLHHPANPGTDELMRSATGGEGSGSFASPATGALNGAIPAGTTRFGQIFGFGSVFPAKASTLDLAVEVDDNPGGDPILVEWFAADGTTLIGSTTVPTDFTGYWALPQSEWVAGQRPPKGGGLVRMTKANGGQIVKGRVVLWYWARVPQ